MHTTARNIRLLVTVSALLATQTDDLAAQTTASTATLRLRGAGQALVSAADAAPPMAKVIEAASGPDGTTLLLDAEFNELRVIDKSGRTTARAGSARPGPGQLRAPTRILQLSDGRVAAVDASRGIVSFRLENGALAPAGIVGARRPLEDGCVVGGSVLELGAHEGKLVHAYTLAGQETAAFATPPTGANPQVVMQLSSSLLGCLPEQSLVVLGMAYSGVVTATDAKGKERWRVTLPQFVGPLVTADGPNGALVREAPGGSFTLKRIGFVAKDVLLVQARQPGRRTPPSPPQIMSWLLDARTGAVLGVQRDLPLFIGVSTERLYTNGEGANGVLHHTFDLQRGTR